MYLTNLPGIKQYFLYLSLLETEPYFVLFTCNMGAQGITCELLSTHTYVDKSHFLLG